MKVIKSFTILLFGVLLCIDTFSSDKLEYGNICREVIIPVYNSRANSPKVNYYNNWEIEKLEYSGGEFSKNISFVSKPFTDKFTLTFKCSVLIDVYVSVHNESGDLIQKLEIDNVEYNVDFSGEKRGTVYLLTITKNDNIIKKYRIEKR